MTQAWRGIVGMLENRAQEIVGTHRLDDNQVMPRYELAGEFFWTIELSGTQVTTGNGKIGNAGHTRIKKLKTAAEAKKHYDALVAEKLEQGYALVR